jgi:predicted nucleotidyltransferase
MIIDRLTDQKLIHPPKWLATNLVFLTEFGSAAYGTQQDNSDHDLAGIVIPPKQIIFPHLAGVIRGFGNQGQSFDQWQETHIKDGDSRKEYDFSVYSIVKIFELARDGNPNILDMIFTPETCVQHITSVGQLIRDNRTKFLSKQIYQKFRGYAYAQIKKLNDAENDKEISQFISMEVSLHIPHSTTLEDVEDELEFRQHFDNYVGNTNRLLGHLLDEEVALYHKSYISNVEKSKRFENRKIQGFDSKYAYHLCRLLNECQQILVKHDMDIQENREQHKAIRRGEWTKKQVLQHFSDKERQLERLYAESTLRAQPDEAELKKLLLDCLEIHYGDLSQAITIDGEAERILRQIADLTDQARSRKLI